MPAIRWLDRFAPSRQREKLGPLASVLARSAQAKVGIACLLLVAFVIYIPIGLAVVCTWGKLGVQECKPNPNPLPNPICPLITCIFLCTV